MKNSIAIRPSQIGQTTASPTHKLGRLLPLLLLFFTAFFQHQTALAQCPNDNTLASANNTVTCGSGLQTIATGISGGQYIGVNLVSGSTYTFETCGLSDPGFDTEMTIYQESNGALLGNNDDACGTDSRVTFTASFTGAVRVLIDVSGCTSNTAETGISASCTASPAPANDLCANAIPISCGTTIAGTTVNATPDTYPQCGSPVIATPAVWYSFVGTGEVATLSMNCASSLQKNIMVYSGTCTALTCAAGRPSICSTPVSFLTTAGTTYFVLINSNNPNQSGAFDLTLTCAPMLPNDLCTGAISITCGSATTGTTIGATSDGDIFSCGIPTIASIGVWYSFVGTGEVMTLSTCTGTDFNTRLRVYTGVCDLLSCFASNDDNAVCGSTALVTFNTTAGTNYTVILDGDTFGDVGNFTLTLTCEPPVANDICVNATPITCGSTTAGTTIGAIGESNVQNCGVTIISTPGVWYSFVGTGNPTTLSVSNCTANDDNTLRVFTGTCSSLTCFASGILQCGVQEDLTFNTTAGTPYFVLLSTVEANASGTFDLSLTCSNAPPPPNDLCANPIPIACGQSITGNTTGATVDPNAICGIIITAPGVWYSFFGTGGEVTLDLCSGTNFNTKLSVFTSDCGALLCTVDNDDFCGTRSSVTFNSTGGTLYKVLVHGSGSQNGAFSLHLTCEETFPPNETATVACPALAIAPTPPTYFSPHCFQDGAQDPVIPTGPVITNNPDPLTCEGTRTFTFTYTDCQDNVNVWSLTYTIERLDFAVPANGAATVACPALAIAPAPPTVTSNCGETLTPTGPTVTNVPTGFTCDGTRTFTFTFTDCEGNSHPWSFAYTIERLDFVVPANGAATVACPALAIAPAPPVVLSNCGETLTPTGPTVTNVPTGFICEGTRTFTFTFTDCEGNSHPWSFAFTIERQPFTITVPNGASTVACPALITQPVPPIVQSNCGETLTPTGPVIGNNPNPITCEGTRTFTFTYTDCEGNTAQWSHVTTVEREPFTIATPNGSATVACPDQTDVQPAPPVVLSACGEILTPVLHLVSAKPGCEGDRQYTFRYTDCEGNTADWLFTYRVEYQDFVIPASEVESLECPILATEPTPPTIFDNCGNLLNPTGPVITSANNAQGCEGSRHYAFTYTDCEGNVHVWSKTFNFEYSDDFSVFSDETATVACLAYAVQPFPPVFYDACGNEIKVALTGFSEDIAPGGCTGWRKFDFLYTDCGGHSHPWSFTYEINDNEAPLGVCPSGNAGASGNSSPVAVSVTNLSCIEEVPCPADYDFGDKMEELLEAGNYFDVCSGDELVVELDSYSDLWQCADPDGDGHFTFGRTFYFRIADPCGNEYPSLCEVTYSGKCLPLETFRQEDWGIAGAMPGNAVSIATTDLSVIGNLLNGSPLTVGGSHRSLTVTDPDCVVNLLPGTGGPVVLANCHQTNCTGCNPMGVGGIKNSLAANAIALALNLRYNVQYNDLNINDLRSQSLACIHVHECILNCSATDCHLRMFDANGGLYQFPHSIGGLLDLANLLLDGGLSLTTAQKTLYGTAINESLRNVNEYWSEGQLAVSCDPAGGAASPFAEGGEKDLLPENAQVENPFGIRIAPNPATRYITLQLGELDEEREVRLEIYNAFGQKKLSQGFGKVSSVSERVELDGLESGMYVAVVQVGYRMFAQKLFISKENGVNLR